MTYVRWVSQIAMLRKRARCDENLIDEDAVLVELHAQEHASCV